MTAYDIAAVTSKIRKRIGNKSGLDATLKFDLGSSGFIHVDGRASPAVVTNDDKPADCTVKIKLDDLVALENEKLNPMTAFMTGKIKVQGNMAVAMKLGPLLKR